MLSGADLSSHGQLVSFALGASQGFVSHSSGPRVPLETMHPANDQAWPTPSQEQEQLARRGPLQLCTENRTRALSFLNDENRGSYSNVKVKKGILTKIWLVVGLAHDEHEEARDCGMQAGPSLSHRRGDTTGLTMNEGRDKGGQAGHRPQKLAAPGTSA